MSLTNVVETDKEIFHGLLFPSNCCEVVQQLRGNIVAIGIPPLDLRFDLLPNGFTALCQCIEPCPMGAFRPFGFTAAFERSQSCCLALAGCAIVGGVRAQLACGAWGRGGCSILLACVCGLHRCNGLHLSGVLRRDNLDESPCCLTRRCSRTVMAYSALIQIVALQLAGSAKMLRGIINHLGDDERIA